MSDRPKLTLIENHQPRRWVDGRFSFVPPFHRNAKNPGLGLRDERLRQWFAELRKRYGLK